MATTKTQPMVTREDLAEAETQHRAASAEVARLAALATGSITRWVTRSEPRSVLTQAGRVERRDVEVPRLETQDVPKNERAAALRALPGAKAHELDSEIARDEVRERFEAAQRQRRQALVERLDAEQQAELRDLVKETDRVAGLWTAFAERSRARDVAYLATGGLREFGMSRYDWNFAPLVDSGEGSQWTSFKACAGLGGR
jgi:hypothetical protein